MAASDKHTRSGRLQVSKVVSISTIEASVNQIASPSQARNFQIVVFTKEL